MSSAEAPANAQDSRFKRWLDQRIPPSHSITLSQKSIFIFPSAAGFAYGALIVLLILGAINYQNSLVYGVAFMLGSLFLVTILYTFRNLSGLTVDLAGADTGFVGESIGFSIRVSRPSAHGARRGSRGREGVQLGWPGAVTRWVELFEQESCVVKLFVPAERRGWLNPGRLMIETYFPLGLLRAWTWVDLEARALIYPRPIFADQASASRRQRDEGELVDPQGSDDFNALRAYRPGDSARHILWRSYARNGELVVKEYASYLDPRLVIDWDQVAGTTEERLSRLTGMALMAARADREFGLKLPGMEIEPGVGEQHLHAALRALALHGL